MKIYITPKDNKGAILIISIIIGVIALAAGLTAANFVSRSTRNITDQESSIKALSIAEAGVEKVLGASDVVSFPCPLMADTTTNPGHIPDSVEDSGNVSKSGTCFFQEDLNQDGVDDQSYYLEVTSKGGASTYTMDEVDKDTVLEISTEGLNGKAISIRWTGPANDQYASILVTEVYEETTGVYKAKKYAYNPDDNHDNNSVGQESNGFPDATFASPNVKTPNITLSSGTKIIRIKPLYFKGLGINVVVESGDSFPTANQGFDIYSTGCTCADILDASSRKNASVRKVKVTKTREHLPAIFDYVLYSGSETDPLTK
jgi:hypothetical protein